MNKKIYEATFFLVFPIGFSWFLPDFSFFSLGFSSENFTMAPHSVESQINYTHGRSVYSKFHCNFSIIDLPKSDPTPILWMYIFHY